MAGQYTLEELGSLLSVKEVAEMFEVTPSIVRRAVKAGTIPGVVEALGRTGFDADLVEAWVVPPSTSRTRSQRDDGRKYYQVALSDDERATLTEQGFDITDKREEARARRAARKLAAAAAGAGATATVETEETDEEDLFAEFEA